MAYSINPYLPRARAIAMRLLIVDGLSVSVVANKCGVHRSTIWRWCQKWLELNKHRQLDNPNRPTRYVGKSRLASCRWTIATNSSRPLVSPHRIRDAVVSRILELRRILHRCAEVIWDHLNRIERIRVSLSSVHRILRRHHQYDGARKNRVRYDNPERPKPTGPGELVQMDTIHYICPTTYRRRYVYTVIDLYTRMAYAEVHSRILPGKAANAIEHAQAKFGFRIAMVQADNGPEFGRYFAQRLARQNIAVRHSRLGRPNDNAHIERFNRTIQEECLGSRLYHTTTNKVVQARLTAYLDYYNYERVHLGLQLKIPASMLQRS